MSSTTDTNPQADVLDNDAEASENVIVALDNDSDETLKEEYESCRWSAEEVKAVTQTFNIFYEAAPVLPSKRTRDQFNEG